MQQGNFDSTAIFDPLSTAPNRICQQVLEPNNLDFARHLLNQPQFQFPGATIGTASAGVISATAVPNREMQLAFRLAF